MLLAEAFVGQGWGGTARQSDLTAVALIKGQIDGGGDALGSAARELGGVDRHLQAIAGRHGCHQAIHSVWKLPG